MLPVSCEVGHKTVILHGLVVHISEVEIKSRVVAPKLTVAVTVCLKTCVKLKLDKIPPWSGEVARNPFPSRGAIGNRQLLGEGESVPFKAVALDGLTMLLLMAAHPRAYDKLNLIV